VIRGVVPFENSTNGSVVQTLDLLADVKRENASVRICGEAFVLVQHCLLGKRRANDSITENKNGDLTSIHQNQKGEIPEEELDFSHIQTLYSHPQAWTQCTPFLRKHLSHAHREDTTSTSRAAEKVALDTTGTTAAICSLLAAELYDLEVLVQGIEEKQGNKTKFLLLRQPPIPETSSQHLPEQAHASETPSPSTSAPPKTLLTFTVPHNDPGALAKALSVFGTHGINLTSMNSRPSGERAWHYLFLVEFEGQRGYPSVEAALAELDGVVEGWRICGSWKVSLDC